jgi:hypothetical protein
MGGIVDLWAGMVGKAGKVDVQGKNKAPKLLRVSIGGKSVRRRRTEDEWIDTYFGNEFERMNWFYSFKFLLGEAFLSSLRMIY